MRSSCLDPLKPMLEKLIDKTRARHATAVERNLKFGLFSHS